MSLFPKPYNWENPDLLGSSVESLRSFFFLFNDLRQPKCEALERRNSTKSLTEHQRDSLKASYQYFSCNPKSLSQFAKSLIKQTLHHPLTVAKLRFLDEERAANERGYCNQQKRQDEYLLANMPQM